jgi:hypothetical protein
MSKISFTGNASGSGSVILQAPNSSTNRTLTVSEVSGNIAISDGSTLTVDYASNRTTIGGKADFHGASTVKLDKWNIIGANTTLSVGQNYFANTRAQANLQLTLPSSANIGDTIMVQDQEGFASSNNVVVLRNGHNIDGVGRNAVLTVDNSGVSLVYESARNGWVSVKHASKDLVGFQGTVSGYTSGGYATSPTPGKVDTIDKFPFAVDTNASDVGNLSQARNVRAGQSSSESGYASGGYAPPQVTTIDKFPFSTDTNATDIGDLTQARNNLVGQSSTTNGYTSGGNAPPFTNTIDKFPFAVDSNASDVGNLSQARDSLGGQSSSVNGYSSGGDTSPGAPGEVNTIDKFPFASDADATDVGDLTQIRRSPAGQSSIDFGYSCGGDSNPGGTRNTIDKFPFASDDNATDVGDLTQARRRSAGQSSTTNGYTSGGVGVLDTIDKFPFASDADATDVGNLTQARQEPSGQQV